MKHFDPPSKQQIEHYQNGVRDWITNAHRDANLGLVPRPFPNPPNSTTTDDSINNTPVDTGQLGVPIESVPIQFRTLMLDGRPCLVILVPDPL